MIARLHAPLVSAGDATVTLSGDEQHFARHVLRLGPGDRVRVFDGRGHEWNAAVSRLNRREVSLALEDPFAPAPEPRAARVLYSTSFAAAR